MKHFLSGNFRYRWSEFRAKQSLDKAVSEGLCWVDEQDEENSRLSYWFPSLFPGRYKQSI